jgi:hypothetical protein
MPRLNPEPWDGLGLQLASVVSEAHRGRGIGSDAVMDFAVSCADAGVTPLWVESVFKSTSDKESRQWLSIWSPYVDFFLQPKEIESRFAEAGFKDGSVEYLEIDIPPGEADENRFYLVWVPRSMLVGHTFFPPDGSSLDRRQFNKRSRAGNKLLLLYDEVYQAVPIFEGTMNVTRGWRGALLRHLDKAVEQLHLFWLSSRLNIWARRLPKKTSAALYRSTRACEGPSTTFNEMSANDIVFWTSIFSDLLNTAPEDHDNVIVEAFPDCESEIRDVFGSRGFTY